MTNLVSAELLKLAEIAPMSAGTRTKLRSAALRVQALEREHATLAKDKSLTYSQACDLLARYAVAVQDRQCCGDEMQPALNAALKACTDAMGLNEDGGPLR